MLAADIQRIHRIAGISNLRDIGGYATREGRTILSGRLFRAAHPGGLDAEGLRALSALGVSAILDLRGKSERQKEALASFKDVGVDDIHVPIEPVTAQHIQMLLSRGDVTAADLHAVMVENYRSYVRDRSHLFAAAMESVVDRAAHGVMVHCTAGKDRTGFLMAMILSALDVAPETIMADYLLTNQTWDGGRGLVPEGVSTEAFVSMKQAHQDYLLAAFEEIEALYGDVDSFLAQGLKLDKTRRESLQAALLMD